MNLVKMFKALGDDTRLRIFNLLIQRELCVCEIEAILEISQSNASQHLNKLKNAGVISCEKESQWVYYKIDDNFKHEPIYEFICSKISKNNVMDKDSKRLNNYKKCGFTCKQIREDKDSVLKHLD